MKRERNLCSSMLFECLLYIHGEMIQFDDDIGSIGSKLETTNEELVYIPFCSRGFGGFFLCA